jgi:hypothetical protein
MAAGRRSDAVHCPAFQVTEPVRATFEVAP